PSSRVAYPAGWCRASRGSRCSSGSSSSTCCPQRPRPDAPAQQRGFTIIERRATFAEVATATERAELVATTVGKMWLRRGGPNASSAAIALRDGTFVSVASLGLAPDELVKVAGSLDPAPGGHAPMAEPTAPALEDIRPRFATP